MTVTAVLWLAVLHVMYGIASSSKYNLGMTVTYLGKARRALMHQSMLPSCSLCQMLLKFSEGHSTMKC